MDARVFSASALPLDEDAKAKQLLGLHVGDDASGDVEFVDYDPTKAELENKINRDGDGYHDEVQQKLDSMDEEIQKLHHMTEASETHESSDNVQDGLSSAAQDEVDRRSVHVGNVDYGSTPQELQEHFRSCGSINRITIMVDKFTGHLKGFAYIEFTECDSVNSAILLSDTMFRGRQLKVTAKRKNIPGFNRGRGGLVARGRGRVGFGFGFRGRGGGHYVPRGGAFPGAYAPRYRGRFIRSHAPY